MRLHRYVWEKFNGTIPKGYHVHHVDHDKNNNDIENLRLLTKSEHQRLHGKEMPEGVKALHIKALEEKARPKACEWHGSERGRKWHVEHGKEVAKKLRTVQIKKICGFCGKDFEDNGFNKALFCSNKCKSAWRRKNGFDNIEKICPACGKTFASNKYNKQQYCSKACGGQMRRQRNQSEKRKASL